MPLPQVNVPRYEMKIPSTGQKVVYRPYLVKEEKILMLAMEANEESQMIRALKDVITSCVESDLKVNSLTMFDIEYIFVQLRTKSVGEKVNVNLACTGCETKNDVQINLAEIQIDIPPDLNKLKNVMLTEEIGVTLKYPSLDNFLESATSNKGATDVLTAQENIDKTFDIISCCIDSIYTKEQIYDSSAYTKKELKDFIDSLNSAQFAKIKAFIETMPAAYIKTSFDCSNCAVHNEVEVKGLANFFG